jgi:predicted RND superfamily exporter protein
MDAFARWLLRHPLLVVAAHAAITAALAAFALQIRFENTLGSLLPPDHPDVVFYEKARTEFGSDDVAVIGVGAHDLFTPQAIAKIAQVTDELAKIDGVEKVVSITNAPDPSALTPEGVPLRLLRNVPPSAADLAALREKLQSIPLYRNTLVAADLRGAAINVFFRPMSDTEYRDLDIDRHIQRTLAAARGTFHHTGILHLRQAAVDLMREDLLRFTPIAMAVMIAVLWFSFWSVRGVALPALSVGMTLVWTLGVMVLAGRSLSLGTVVLPPLLVVIGSVYAIHVLARYFQLGEEETADDGGAAALASILGPVMLSALTTMIGFASLMLSPISAVWDLGLFSAIGVFFCAFSAVTFLPAALKLSGLSQGAGITSTIANALSGSLTWIGLRAHALRRRILLAFAIIAAITLVGISRIQVDSDLLDTFDKNSKIRRDSEMVNEHIAGTAPFFVVVDAGAAGALKKAEVLRQIKNLQEFVTHLPGVRSTLSIADYVELYGGGEEALWSDSERIETIAGSVGRADAPLGAVVNEDLSRGNIAVRTSLSSSRDVERTVAAINTWVAQNLPATLKVQPTGNLVLMAGSTTGVVASQMRSLTLALVVIFGVMALMFLSVRVGFLAVIPNAVAIAVFFGAMGWLRIPLNLGTSLIAAIALGVAVDSTIHYLSRLNVALKGEADAASASVRSLRTVGPAIVLTTIALVIGFLTFTFSDFVPIREFGTLAAGTMAAAMIANIGLLPALVAGTKVITLWDLVAVRMGENPTETIPLFRGLGPGEARIVVLMGELGHFEANDTIVRRGESGHDMYVILNGTTRVVVDKAGAPTSIAELRRGEVFGEMALLRHDARTADVVAAGPVDVLALNEQCFQRLQERYPRVAAKLLLNLSRILSDRLQRMTDAFSTKMVA